MVSAAHAPDASRLVAIAGDGGVWAHLDCRVNPVCGLCVVCKIGVFASRAIAPSISDWVKRQGVGQQMKIEEQIEDYIASHPEPKRSDLRALHELTLQVSPSCKLWFTDGKDEHGKTVANPNIGYGFYTITYADGRTREFYRIGLSANKTGISVYILGLDDKTYLARTYGPAMGKASVTGYCIKFRALKDINIDALQAAIRYGLELNVG